MSIQVHEEQQTREDSPRCSKEIWRDFLAGLSALSRLAETETFPERRRRRERIRNRVASLAIGELLPVGEVMVEFEPQQWGEPWVILKFPGDHPEAGVELRVQLDDFDQDARVYLEEVYYQRINSHSTT